MKKIACLFSLLSFAFLCVNCDVEQTKEAKMPDVDVTMDEGQLPAWDVEWADIDVGTTTKTVSVPKIKVVMEEEEIEVPYIDVDMPDEYGDKEELVLVSEAEVSGETHTIEIMEVIATGKRLNVISELKPTGKDLGEERMRVSDRVVLMAPDLDVKHYIIGQRPPGIFNIQYTYVNDRAQAMKRIENGTSIYKRPSALSYK